MGKNSSLKRHYIDLIYIYIRSFQVALVVKNPPGNVEDIEMQVDPWVRKSPSPWRRACESTPVFLLGESHGQKSLAGFC